MTVPRESLLTSNGNTELENDLSHRTGQRLEGRKHTLVRERATDLGFLSLRTTIQQEHRDLGSKVNDEGVSRGRNPGTIAADTHGLHVMRFVKVGTINSVD